MHFFFHVAAGAATGAVVKRPSKAFSTGIVVHLVADLIPHQEHDTSDHEPDLRTGLLDAITGIGLLALFAKLCGRDSGCFAGALGAALPDAEHLMPWNFRDAPPLKLFPTHFFSRELSALQDRSPWRASSRLQLALAALLGIRAIWLDRVSDRCPVMCQNKGSEAAAADFAQSAAAQIRTWSRFHCPPIRGYLDLAVVALGEAWTCLRAIQDEEVSVWRPNCHFCRM